MLGILSEDLSRWPQSFRASVLLRDGTRSIRITVSAAYRDLEDRGWLELRRGSGLYVRPLQSSAADPGELDVLLADSCVSLVVRVTNPPKFCGDSNN